jgi:MFS family permease
MTPEIVPPSQLLAANTLLSVAGIVATAVGALVGGWIVDHWGWQVALYIDACTYLVSVVSLALVRYRQHPRPAAPAITLRGYLGEILEGLQVVRRSAPVGLALTALGAVWLGGGFLQVAGNLHIQRAASIPGMERIGVLMTVVGLGMGLGTWWVNTRARRLPSAAVLGGGLLVAAGALVAFAVSTRFAVFAGAGFLAGIGLAPAFVLTETLLQQGTDLAARGRVFSLRDFSMRLGFQLAILAATLLTPRLGTTFAMLVAAGLMTLAGLSSLAWGPRLRAEGAVPRP